LIQGLFTMHLPSVFAARFTLAAPLVLFASLAQAAAIYQWTDDQGRVQFSDSVPERYKRTATEVQVERFKAAPKATVQTDSTLAKPRPEPRDPPNPPNPPNPLNPTTAPSAGISAAPPPSATQSAPRNVRSGKTDCATLQQEYAASQACFAPYVTAFGGVKAEAFDNCTPVVDPSPQCGPLRLP
jgi:hypothetical protein